MEFKVEVLEAYHGDCILISYIGTSSLKRNIIIDGGISRTYSHHLKPKIENILKLKQNIDLLILTHIDDDHIGGVLKFYEDNTIDKTIVKKVWFNSEIIINKINPNLIPDADYIYIENNNSTRTSYNQGVKLEEILFDLGCIEDDVVQVSKKYRNYDLDGVKITVLSPNIKSIIELRETWKRENSNSCMTAGTNNDYSSNIEDLIENEFNEDKSITNKSSIAILAEYNGKNYLFLGDAHPTDIIESLKDLGYNSEKKLKLELVKLAHHGSKKNINDELLSILDCTEFIISTNGNRHNLPNKETLARIVSSKENINLYFNYEIMNSIFKKEECEKYKFNMSKKCIF